MFKRFFIAALAIFSVSLAAQTAISQVSITQLGNAGSYSQNFNGTFLGTADYNLTNNAAGNLGWYSVRTTGNATPNVIDANNGWQLPALSGITE